MIESSAYDTWRALADKALKGAPFEMLRTPVPGGDPGLARSLEPLSLPQEPVYAGRAAAGRWDVMQRVDRTGDAAAQAREDLANGATALAIVFAQTPGAFGRGLTSGTVDALDEALAGVVLAGCPLVLEAGIHGAEALALLTALAERRGEAPPAVHLAADPFATLAATGEGRDAPTTTAALLQSVRAFAEGGLSGTALAADGRVAAEAGAAPVEELAFAFMNLHATVGLLDAAGVSAAEALPLVALHLTASQDQIATIAKLRAARALHRLYVEAYGLDLPARIHVTTLSRMLTRQDAHTNLLRLAIATFAAGVGGADAVTVLPFDEAASPFARRMARNLQSLLLEEAHIDAMSDPGAGSGTIETCTDEIADAAWKIFQRHAGTPPVRLLEAPHPLAAGILATAARLDGERVIIGVTRHPPAEPAAASAPAAPAVLTAAAARTPASGAFADLVAAALEGATLDDLAAALGEPLTVAPAALAPTRASAPHEA